MALPALVILIGTIATVVISLNRISGEVDRVEGTLTKRSAEAAVQSTLRLIGKSHRDYAEWDDAVRRLYGTIDPVFFFENFDSTTTTELFFDTAYILDEEKRSVVATRQGTRISLPIAEAFGPSINLLLDGLPDDGKTYGVGTGVLSGVWGTSVVAAGPIVPSTADSGLASARARYLVIAKSFDDDAVKALGEEFVLSGLRLVGPGGSPADRLDIHDPSGLEVASLTWEPAGLGKRAYAEIGPAVIAMLSLISITVLILIVIAHRGFVKLKKSEDQARYAAAHDSLSGLPNRAELLRLLVETLATVRSQGDKGAAIFLDLDGFKQVNDTYGHDIGDRLLRSVSDVFHTVSDDYLIARIGGDEFAIVLIDDHPIDSAIKLAKLFISKLTQTFEIDGRAITVGCSIGVAAIDRTIQSADEVLRRADVAMYKAKQDGRNRVCVYDESIDAARRERSIVAAELEDAMRTGGLDIAYQPIFDAKSRKIVGTEALLRWPRPGKVPLTPDLFVPIAEESGLIDELGLWILRRTCSDASAWPNIRLAVNVSPIQFRNPKFESTVSGVLEEFGFEAKRLELELTENHLAANPDQARKCINAIRSLGIGIALDDFGSGFSSIGYLRSFTFDRLKLDRTLITEIDSDERVQRLVQAIVALADSLELDVVAEGVENEREAVLLGLAGCRELQGFHLARPCSAEQITKLVNARGEAANSSSAFA